MSKIILSLSSILAILLLTSCNSLNSYTGNYFYFNTGISVKVGGYYNEDELDSIGAVIDDTFSYYDKITSKRVDYSSENIVNVYNINSNPTATHYLSDELYNIIKLSTEMYDITGSTFNVALDPVVSLWEEQLGKFDLSTEEPLEPPTQSMIESELNYTYISSVQLDDDDKSITMSEGMSLNFGGMAKGYAVDIVADNLKNDKDIEYFIINAGGSSISVYGNNPNKYRNNWVIGLEDPIQNDMLSSSCFQCYYTDISLPSGYTVSTSGDYQKYFIGTDGEKYHHIIDPSTGYPVVSNVKSVTVITNNGTDADIISTALFIMDIDEAIKYVNETSDLEAIWYLSDGTILRSNNFSNFES